MQRLPTALACLALVVAVSTGPSAALRAPQGDPAKELSSKDPLVRLAALRTLASNVDVDDRKALKLIVDALDDKDWEVVENAALVLGDLGARGAPGAEDALGDLIDLAIEGPIFRIRRAAGDALARIDGMAAYEKLVKKAKGDAAPRALEAVARLAPAIDGELGLEALTKRLDDKEVEVQRAAARAIVALAGKGRAGRIEDLAGRNDVVQTARVLEAAAGAADPSTIDALLELLARYDLDETLERRTIEALRSIAVAHPDEKDALQKAASAKLDQLEHPHVRLRFAHLFGRLGEKRDGKPALDADTVTETLVALTKRSKEDVRAAALRELARVGSDAAYEAIAPLAESDADAYVRLVAFRMLADREERDEDRLRAVAVRLLGDADERVREAAAVALGVLGSEEAVAPLEGALADEKWTVAVAAAVSLGKTSIDAAAPALIAMYGSDDWRRRGGAIAGLAKLRAKEGVDTVIAAVEDDEPVVVQTALTHLRSLSNLQLGPKRKAWQEWWDESQERVRLKLPIEVLKRRKELEYVTDDLASIDALIYAGLDVVVLESRGDHIQELFDFLKLEHRMTRSGTLVEDAVQPGGVFVANCTGEVTAPEIERLQWFVHAGGYLFGSCWALHETIAKVAPGYVRRLPTPGQVLDDVPAYPTDAKSPWLELVFPDGVRPIYRLEGAYLIDVVAPELVEVLVDSPECAAHWGGGNLAAWFRVGHGVVLDSVNHFDLQGLETALGLKNGEDRQAYAIDHLGLSYAGLREVAKEKFWNRSNLTAERIKDMSVFRLVTNFVRNKRIFDQ